MQEQYVLEMEHISKTFPGVRALDDINFKARKGTVHALMGENGAGKSTLMKILGGMYTPDTGSIKVKGKQIQMLKPSDSIQNGISMIHQELTSVFEMTVAENIFLGREPVQAKFWVNEKKLNEDTRILLESLEISIDPKTKMKELSVARMQLVEIAKAISYNSEIIIMDEPTSAITDREVAHLFKIIRTLTKKGISIIYISHKMDEIFEIAEEITVLRDGKFVDCKSTKVLTQQDLISMMVGRELKDLFPKKEVKIGEIVLEVKNLSLKGKFKNISFQLRKGEILGVAGLMGSGRSEVMESIFGLTKPDEGEVFLHGEKVNIKSPIDAKKNGLAFITEDRKITGLFLPHSVKDNIIAASLQQYSYGVFMNEGKIRKVCNAQKQLLGIKTPSINQKVNNLSGGNQQKVLIAKWLLTDADVIILDEPTRGVDVGAKSEIHSLIGKLVEQGKSVIMISSEMPEVLGMSDRIIVMHQGKIFGELSREEANQDAIMKYASGLVTKIQ
jgi:inositol transport system ATP-binding protein